MSNYTYVRLPDLWWYGKNRKHPDWQPQHYVCPRLMTLSIWLYRLRGKDAHWQGVKRVEGQDFPPRDTDGSYATTAMVLIGNGEASCLFPHWMTSVECAYMNFGLSRHFFEDAWHIIKRHWRGKCFTCSRKKAGFNR
jgi:hypothetical protein